MVGMEEWNLTGSNIIVMAWASGKVTTRGFCSIGLFHSPATLLRDRDRVLMFYTTQYTLGGGAVGLTALSTASAKTSLTFIPALTLGIMCNALVCLAVWICFSARTSIDRVATVIPPIAAFAAAGFEHCIANIYFIPIGLFIKAGAPDVFWKAIGKTPQTFRVDLGEFLCGQSEFPRPSENYRWVDHGCRHLLVHLPAQSKGKSHLWLKKRAVARPIASAPITKPHAAEA